MNYQEAVTALSKRNFVPAIAVFLGNLAYNPNDGHGWMHLGIAYTETGHQEAALEALHRADLLIEAAPLSEALGCAYMRIDKLELARNYLEEAIALPDCPSSAYRNLGVVMLRLGDAASAEALIDIALDCAPDDAQTLYARTLLLDRRYRLGDLRAKEMLLNALEDLLRRPGAPVEIRHGATRRLAGLASEE